MLKLLAPIIPFITHTVYKNMYTKDIHSEQFPLLPKITTTLKTENIIEINSMIWKAKKEKNLPLKTEVLSLTLPITFKSLQKDLKATHKIKKISFGKEIMISL